MTPQNGDDERRDDPLLESCLDEILGGQTPPDLTSHILARWTDHEPLANVSPPPFRNKPAPLRDKPAAPPIQAPVMNGGHRPLAVPRRRPRARWVWITLTACALVFVGVMTYPHGPFRSSATPESNLAQSTPQRVAPTQAAVSPRVPTNSRDNASAAAQADDDSASTGSKPQPRQAGNDDDGVQDRIEVAVPVDSNEPVRVAAGERLRDEQIVELINARIRERWQLAEIQPSGSIGDDLWCRRVYQRVLGRSASDDELRRFLRRTDSNKREWLVEQLFSDPRYRREFAEYWAGYWSDRLLASLDESHTAQLQREGLARHVQDALENDRPHDQWVAELLTAQGSNSLRADDTNEATNFVIALWEKDAAQLSSEFCRVLLGQRIQCAQCHDDPVTGTRQERFWQMTAFFSQIDIQRLSFGKVRLANRDSARPVSYQEASGSWKTVEPTFLDGTRIDPHASADPRVELARLVTRSDRLAKAAVNRIWSHFLGFGFTSPVDDIGRHNSPSHPELLRTLAQQFVRHGYDTQRLIRWIVLSEPFGRSNDIHSLSEDVPEIGFVAYFSRNYHRSSPFATPVQAIDGLTDGQAHRVALKLELWGRVQEFDEDGKPTDSREKARNKKRNSKVHLGKQLTHRQRAMARALAASKTLSDDQRLEHVFLNMLARWPTDSEMERARTHFTATKNRIRAIENLTWALTRTQEYTDEH